MEENKTAPTSVDEYIALFPADVQQVLSRIRAVIKQAASEAEEKIAYRMPGYYLNGPLVYFAGFKQHIGFYPTASNLEPFQNELAAYKRGKGSIQFPLNQPIPYELIEKIVRFRVAENLKA
jgi:uncharacterized protein YdhG (YjbR/CyaY superfamily)